jgi:hypothetical protein
MPSPALSPFSPNFSRVALACSLLTLCLFLCSSIEAVHAADAKADAPYALIFGTVWGPDNQAVYGVNVKIRRADQKKARWNLHSDHHGEFAQRVPAGRADYVVWADLKGYKPPDGKKLAAAAEVTVHVENDERVDTGVHLK